MAQMIIMLRRDPKTGKQNVIVKLDSDPDALPVEHEQMHRAKVEQLLGKSIDPEDLGEIVIEREPAGQAEEPIAQPGEAERQKAGHKG
jgi:hypothetical protein